MFGINLRKFPPGLWIALSSIAVVHIAAYIIVPILPIILKSEKGLNAAQVGVVIGATSLSLQLGSLVAGFIADRAGRRSALALGSILSAISILGLGFSESYMLLILSALLNGTGAGIFGPTAKAAIAALEIRTPHRQQPIRITASLGVASLVGAQSDNGDLLIKRADDAMYKAKSRGNFICVSEDPSQLRFDLPR